MLALGGGDLFKIADDNSRHKNISFPGHSNANLYDIGKMPGAIFKYLKSLNI